MDTLTQGVLTSPNQFREMLVLEAIPLIQGKVLDLSSHTVNRIMAISLEYYMNQMFQVGNDTETIVQENWIKIFEILDMCGKHLKWELFLPFNKNWSKDVYWQKIIQIVSSAPPRPSENKQILFCATIIFVLSLQDYISSTRIKTSDYEVDFILVEGFKEYPIESSKRRKMSDVDILETPKISCTAPCTNETSKCLITAANCWQLLHSNEILQMDFSQIMSSIPISEWIKRFLVDLSVYLGRNEETASLLKDHNSRGISKLEQTLRLLSLSRMQGMLNVRELK